MLGFIGRQSDEEVDRSIDLYIYIYIYIFMGYTQENRRTTNSQYGKKRNQKLVTRGSREKNVDTIIAFDHSIVIQDVGGQRTGYLPTELQNVSSCRHTE